jgi:Tol biopolymer transport system component
MGLVAVLVASGELARAAAGPEPNDIQDSQPAWLSDGVHVAFARSAAGELRHVLETTSAGKDTFVANEAGTLDGTVPGTSYLLIQDGDTIYVTSGGRFDHPRAVLSGTHASASRDGSQIAWVRDDGTLAVASVDGTGARTLATGIAPPSWDITGPAWSPDDSQIVIASGSSLLLANADGSGSRVLFSGANQSVNPSWSHEGSQIAFERNASPHWQIWIVNADGTNPRMVIGAGASNDRYPVFSPVSNTLAFISDRQHVTGGATQFQFALYTETLTDGVARKLVNDVHPTSAPRWSVTAALIAVSAGQECRRWGIYVVRSSVGSRPHRVSNQCRFDGTTGADVIHGSPYFDRINGLGGNDRLYGSSGNDAIYGENGNDTLYGNAGNDFIVGGPGDDRVFAGSGNDVIVPGNGRDRIDCGAGKDVVEGAGPLDTIAKNCEIVRR